MELDEREFIRRSARLVEEWENTPRSLDEHYSSMTHEDVVRVAMYQQELLAAKERELKERESELAERKSELELLNSKIDRLLDQQDKANETLASMARMLSDKDTRIMELDAMNKALTEQLKRGNKERFGSKSQKGPVSAKAKKAERSRQQDKDDFDGTPGSIGGTDQPSSSSESSSESAHKARTENQMTADMLRRGSSYRRTKADNKVTHRSDLSRLPAGAVIIKVTRQYAYEQKTVVTEHEYDVVTYKTGDRIVTAHIAEDGTVQTIDRVPGTHASADFLAHLAVNRFVLDTPLYREMIRLEEEGMRLSRKSLTNWLYKGSLYLTGMVEELKKTALVKDSIVNCDETWCRVKVHDRYRKRYIWCLVNKEARIVIYCYEDGSRGRDVLRDIIGGAEIKALQSDGYNVYMYLDKEMIGIDHLCCMAHARAKFKYACEISGDEDARYRLSMFAQLYAKEDTFKKAGLTPEQIGLARRSPDYLDIIGQLRSKLQTLTTDGHPPRGELMEKAIRYLDTFWKQLFRYLDDGRYPIDNNIAERNIRPLAGERKNSLFFGSHKMAKASAMYHTAISTCRMMGVSVMEYLKTFFRRIIEGERNYSLLMPQTIGICVKNA